MPGAVFRAMVLAPTLTDRTPLLKAVMSSLRAPSANKQSSLASNLKEKKRRNTAATRVRKDCPKTQSAASLSVPPTTESFRWKTRSTRRVIALKNWTGQPSLSFPSGTSRRCATESLPPQQPQVKKSSKTIFSDLTKKTLPFYQFILSCGLHRRLNRIWNLFAQLGVHH